MPESVTLAEAAKRFSDAFDKLLESNVTNDQKEQALVMLQAFEFVFRCLSHGPQP